VHIQAHQKCLASEKGFTLIELLVGAFIGLFLTGAMIQAYSSTKQTYLITQNIGRIQEDTRFAYYFLTRDLRETSSLGCLRSVRDIAPDSSDLSDLSIKVGGWDHVNTSPGDDAILLTDTYAVSTVDNNWQGLNNGVNNRAPNPVNSIPNSDVIAIKKITPITGAILTASGNNSLNIQDYTASEQDMLIVGNCQRADQFVVDDVTGNIVTPEGSFNFLEDWDQEARLYSVSNVVYYVGYRAGSDSPSLFRYEQAPLSTIAPQAEELVEGVESMQVLYGIDLNGDGTANRYVSARDVAGWRDIVSVRIGFLMIAINAKGVGAPEAENFSIADGIVFTAAANNRNLRYTTNLTVKTRNLGLSENFSVCRASTSTVCDSMGFIPNLPSSPLSTP